MEFALNFRSKATKKRKQYICEELLLIKSCDLVGEMRKRMNFSLEGLWDEYGSFNMRLSIIIFILQFLSLRRVCYLQMVKHLQ